MYLKFTGSDDPDNREVVVDDKTLILDGPAVEVTKDQAKRLQELPGLKFKTDNPTPGDDSQ